MLKNSTRSYGWISISLHWSMALVIIFLFGLGLYMVDLDYYHRWYKSALDLHKSIGVLVFGLLILRLIWRALNVRPIDLAGPRWQQLAAHWVHLALYVFMLALMLSGYLISTATGREIEVFDLFSIAALPWAVEQQEDIAGDIHEILAWTLIITAAIHAMAALKHHFINKDDGLRRIVSPHHSN